VTAATVLDTPRLDGIRTLVVHDDGGKITILRENIYHLEMLIGKSVAVKIVRVLFQFWFQFRSCCHAVHLLSRAKAVLQPALGAAKILCLTERLEIGDAVSADHLPQIRRVRTLAAPDSGLGIYGAGQFRNRAEFAILVHLLKFLV